ncbi:MAG: 30S ribosomal protein S4e [Candidatus Aenigmatarchaeota archaeon]
MKLKRECAPEFWKIAKKSKAWAFSPSPGPHPMKECIPLGTVLRDMLKVVETGAEAKKIIKQGKIMVDGKARKDLKFPVGLMDVVSIPELKKSYRAVLSEKGLALNPIDADAEKKICKIIGKTSVSGKTQLNLHDNRNIITGDGAYKTGESIVIEIPSQKILEHIRLDAGCTAMISHGKNAGKIGKIKNFKDRKITMSVDNEEIQVRKDFVMLLGKDKPAISLQ